jgi:hypothetical protein
MAVEFGRGECLLRAVMPHDNDDDDGDDVDDDDDDALSSYYSVVPNFTPKILYITLSSCYVSYTSSKIFLFNNIW